ncbi:glycosyltransferase family 9 protein [Streptomyces bomunensis]|uniref:Glycosyltransferase family 9 protein n=2 Tax=Streptomyces montanisoli TaxID=2798581 RepID=A0A940RZ55_9ACTN|nr:glycosyltransferase family 9 protein [Streptomyces montanisoli]
MPPGRRPSDGRTHAGRDRRVPLGEDAGIGQGERALSRAGTHADAGRQATPGEGTPAGQGRRVPSRWGTHADADRLAPPGEGTGTGGRARDRHGKQTAGAGRAPSRAGTHSDLDRQVPARRDTQTDADGSAPLGADTHDRQGGRVRDRRDGQTAGDRSAPARADTRADQDRQVPARRDTHADADRQAPPGGGGRAPDRDEGRGHPNGGARPRLLVLRALGLGDLLAGVPALKALRRARPEYEIVLAAPEALRDAVRTVGAVDTLFPASAPGRGVPGLTHWTGPRPDLAVDLHGNGPASRDALAALAPRRLLAFAEPSPVTPRWRADEHERDRWCRFLRAYGIAADPADVRLPPPRDRSPAPGAVVVHPGAESAARRWPADRYADVIGGLRARGHRVVVTGGPAEDELLGHLAARTGLPPRDVFSGGLPYPRLAALIAGASLLISGDTGPAHVAVAYGTPSVTLFGPVAPSLWGPPAGGPHRALWHAGPPGDPHGTVPDPLLLRITTAEVLAAADALAGRGERRHHAAV